MQRIKNMLLTLLALLLGCTVLLGIGLGLAGSTAPGPLSVEKAGKLGLQSIRLGLYYFDHGTKSVGTNLEGSSKEIQLSPSQLKSLKPLVKPVKMTPAQKAGLAILSFGAVVVPLVVVVGLLSSLFHGAGTGGGQGGNVMVPIVIDDGAAGATPAHGAPRYPGAQPAPPARRGRLLILLGLAAVAIGALGLWQVEATWPPNGEQLGQILSGRGWAPPGPLAVNLLWLWRSAGIGLLLLILGGVLMTRGAPRASAAQAAQADAEFWAGKAAALARWMVSR